MIRAAPKVLRGLLVRLALMDHRGRPETMASMASLAQRVRLAPKAPKANPVIPEAPLDRRANLASRGRKVRRASRVKMAISDPLDLMASDGFPLQQTLIFQAALRRIRYASRKTPGTLISGTDRLGCMCRI